MIRLLRPAIFSIFILLLLLFSVSCNDNPTDSDNGGDNGNGNGENGDPFSHTRNPGISANDFLSSDNFSTLIIEIDFMEGFAPNERALDSLQLFLEQRLNKTDVIILSPTEIASGGQSNYSANEVRELEQQHRDEFTRSDTLTAYMIILDTSYEQSNVLGIAYFNTSTAYFGEAYEEATSGLNAPSRYRTEAISFRHEFGHLLGLVGIPNSGTDMQTDHKDEDHGNHCDNNRCLMYWAMERPDLFEQFLTGEHIPSLDANCIADLQGNEGK